MDRPSANANEYTASTLRTRSPYDPTAGPSQGRTHDGVTALQSSTTNAVDDAFVAFQSSRMAASTEASAFNANVDPHREQRPADKGADSNTRGRDTLDSSPRRGGRGAYERLGRDSSFGDIGHKINGEAVYSDGHEGGHHQGSRRGRGERPGGLQGYGNVRGRMLDLSHVRGRGRGGHMPERLRGQEDLARERGAPGSHDRQDGGRGRFHRGGRDGHSGRRGHGHPPGHSGRGRAVQYDADFDRGKSAEEKRAEARKQLYQAPMGYRSDSRPEEVEQKTAEPHRQGDRAGQKMQEADGTVDDTDHDGSDDHDLMNVEDGQQDSPELAARPGIINTGIDITAVQPNGRRGKGERRERNRRRDDRGRSDARDRSLDKKVITSHETQGPFDHDLWPRHMHPPPPPPPFGGPPASHYLGGPPPFSSHHPYPPPPPPGHVPDHFDPHAHSRGKPPPMPHHRHWPPPHPFDSPPRRHREHPDIRSRQASERDTHRGDARHTKQNRGSGHVKKMDAMSAHQGTSRDEHERSSLGLSSPVPAARQLFNPSRDDPVKFSVQAGSATSMREGSLSASDARSMVSSATHSSASTLSVASSSYKSRHSARSDALLDEVESTASGAGSNALLRELKASYREILNVEAKLQDEDSYAKSAMDERTRGLGCDNVVTAVREDRPDEYWAKLVQLHRDGAEAFHSFMERCMDPMIPASIHSIPQKYNLSSRMWKSAFLLLLNRLRHALPDGTERSDNTPEHVGNVLDHLTDFVYYAYTFYTQLLEQQSLSAFRGTWIEQLGDIARFRMAVSELPIQPQSNTYAINSLSTSTKSLKPLLDGFEGEEASLPPPQPESDKSRGAVPRKQLVSRKDRKKGFPGIPAKLAEDMEVADTPGNSIGAAALDDWELVEHETWKNVAQDWYFLGLSETPGTGRLHHHLAAIAHDDDLRALYHYSKSVAASHPYSSGSDSILDFFSPDKQASRLRPDASALSLFVHLHGLLYTRVDLHRFTSVLGRFEEKLEETFAFVRAQAERPSRRMVRGRAKHDPAQRLNCDSTWIMIAVINIAAVMEYGREGGLLKSAMAKAQDQKKSEKQSTKADKRFTPRVDPTPSEASLNELARQVERLGLEISKNRSTSQIPDKDVPAIPLHLRLAIRLSASVLNNTLRHPTKPGEVDPAICPYITIVLTFLATLAHNATALAILRLEIPWANLVKLFDGLPKYAVDACLRQDSPIPNRLLGVTLPEDWCIRGLEWTGKQLFGRGYWKGKVGTAYLTVAHSEPTGRNEATSYSMPQSEKDVLAERYEGPSMPPHAGGPHSALVQGSTANGNEDNQLDEDGDPPTDRENVARLRWKRVALTAAWLARAIPFISIENGKVTFDAVLYEAITKDDGNNDMPEPSLLQDDTKTDDNAHVTVRNAEAFEMEDDEDDYLLGSGDENETVKELKARRRELKALLQESRESRNNKTQQAIAASADPSAVSQQKRPNGTSINALAGYTTLVFDTNVLLESMEVFMALLTSRRWSLVVPLAVVTELDGLRTKEDNLGTSATQAIKSLEDAIKTYSTNLKVQTSRGNYLRDLNIRREDIDFGHSPSYSGGRKSAATDGSIKSMDDVILNVAIWQKTNWLDRRALLGIKANNTADDKHSTSSSTTPAKTVLVSSDRTLRLKGKARGLEVCDASALQQLLEQPPNG